MLQPLVVPAPTAVRPRVLPRAFHCTWTNGGLDASWVHVAGVLDIATTPCLEQTLSAPMLRTRLVVLDLRELEFMDSSGVHVIVDASVRTRKVGGRLVVLRGPADVDRMFALTGSADDVEIADIDPVEPAVQVLLHLTGDGRPSPAEPPSDPRLAP